MRRGTGVLEAPERDYVPGPVTPRRVSASPNLRLRQDFDDDVYQDVHEDLDEDGGARLTQRRPGLRLSLRGLPRTRAGRIAAGVGALLLAAMCVGVLVEAHSLLMHDERFFIPSTSSIEIEGNTHVTRAELLSVFGEDVERNIFRVSLPERRAELQALPWVAHATVMRLLPNRLRVSIVERTPVAFVRQGSHIGLVDATGVLLDMPADEKMEAKYSFPVVSGIVASDPLSTRAARMKIFERFTAELDGSGEKISQGLSEVDLSNPEDVKALIPDRSMDILVHFGDSDFLNRYQRFEEHLPEWRTTYPKLSSVDMRYERQVVLEMQPGSGGTGSSAAVSANSTATASPTKAAAVHPATAKLATKLTVAAKHPALKAVKAKQAGKTQTAGKNQIAYTAKKPVPVKQNSQKKPAAHGEKVVQTSGSGPQYHASQVAHP